MAKAKDPPNLPLDFSEPLRHKRVSCGCGDTWRFRATCSTKKTAKELVEFPRDPPSTLARRVFRFPSLLPESNFTYVFPSAVPGVPAHAGFARNVGGSVRRYAPLTER